MVIARARAKVRASEVKSLTTKNIDRQYFYEQPLKT